MAELKIERMSWDAFLAWTPPDGGCYELVDGVPRAMTGARVKHDRVVRRTLRALEDRLAGGPCEPFTDDIAVVIPNGNVRRPDVTVDCGRIDPEEQSAAAPVLVVEVLSRSTMDYDLLIKILDYKSHPTIRYILFLKPDDYAGILHARAEGGPWADHSLIGPETLVDLPGLGLAIPLADLYPPRT